MVKFALFSALAVLAVSVSAVPLLDDTLNGGLLNGVLGSDDDTIVTGAKDDAGCPCNGGGGASPTPTGGSPPPTGTPSVPGVPPGGTIPDPSNPGGCLICCPGAQGASGLDLGGLLGGLLSGLRVRQTNPCSSTCSPGAATHSCPNSGTIPISILDCTPINVNL